MTERHGQASASGDEDRYERLRLIPWWDQQRLANSRVLVAGAGALGNEVLKGLALLGVGHIYVVDFDRIEVSNLSRTVLFRASDRGRSKSEVAAERVRELNPDVRTQAFHCDVVRELGLGVFRRVDLVFGCLDNREARWAINRACRMVGTPWIDGALDGLNGSVKIFRPNGGACYECGMTVQDRQWMNRRYSCTALRGTPSAAARVATTITSASIIAGMQVQEGLKLLHGLPVDGGSALLYHGLRMRATNLKLVARATCPAHERLEPIVEMHATSAVVTIRGLLEFARHEMTEDAVISFDRELIVQARCSGCGATTRVMRAYEYRPPESPCGRCGEPCFVELTHTFDRDSPFLDTPLASLGIPLLHIIRIETRGGERAIHVELAGDEHDCLIDAGAGGSLEDVQHER